MTGKEALEEIKNYTLATYDEDGNEEECYKFGELEPNLIEAIEEELVFFEKYKKNIKIIRKAKIC